MPNPIPFNDDEDDDEPWFPLFDPSRKHRRGRARYDPLRRDAYLAAQRDAYHRRKAETGRTQGFGTWGGGGRMPTYEGYAARAWTHPGLQSLPRLAYLVYLCTRGPATAPDLVRACGKNHASGIVTLRQMEGTRLVTERPEVLPFRQRHDGPPATLFEATLDARRYLVRLAIITARHLAGHYHGRPLRNDVNTDPFRAVLRHVQPVLLKPSAIIVAREMQAIHPRSAPQIAEHYEMNVSVVHDRLGVMRRLGWVDEWDRRYKTIFIGTKHERPIGGPRRLLMKLNDTGRLAIDRHEDAIRRAARASGHQPEWYDWHFTDPGMHMCDPETGQMVIIDDEGEESGRG